jgi:hypothetical protein
MITTKESLCYAKGYMKAIESTNVSELLEALIMIKIGGLGNFTKKEQEKINNAIKKATE